MATQSILKHGMVSPARAMLKTTSFTRSILKRAGTSPISPTHPYAASFSMQSSPILQSAHVQFLPSPSLVSTYTAHSAASYDRTPISVSPLERTYMTSLEGFELSAPPKPFRSIVAAQSSPAITDFEDPRSPKVQPAAKQAFLRFEGFGRNPTVPSQTLAKSVTSYPRSPYPSAPGHPEADARWPKDRDTDDGLAPRNRSSSLELPKRNKKGLTLAAPFVTPHVPTPSLGPPVPSINNGKKPAPLDTETRLSQAFWEVVSLEEAEKSADEVMVTALEYPASAVQCGEIMDSQPQIMYGDADGVLWSPGLPESDAAVDNIRDSLMSPGKRSSLRKIVRKDFTAPSPNDPFAAFPSFAAVMERGSLESVIAYPSRAALQCGI